MSRDSHRLLFIFLLTIPLLSMGQSRRELKKCIDTYRWRYVQNCVLPADTEDVKKAVAAWFYLDGWSYNSQTDSSVTFSKSMKYMNVDLNQSWEDAWLAHWYSPTRHKYNGIVTVRVGVHDVKHGKDISVVAYTRERWTGENVECLVPHVEPDLRDYLFAALNFEVAVWPQELGEAVDRYNSIQIYPDRRLALR